MEVKVIQRSVEGYSARALVDFYSATRMPDPFSIDGMDRKLVPVAGICIQTTELGFECAEDLSCNSFGHGYLSFEVPDMDSEDWDALEKALSKSYSEDVDLILVDADRASPENQTKLEEMITIHNGHLWIFTVQDHRRLIPALKKRFLVYLGLSAESNMHFLVQDEHAIIPSS